MLNGDVVGFSQSRGVLGKVTPSQFLFLLFMAKNGWLTGFSAHIS